MIAQLVSVLTLAVAATPEDSMTPQRLEKMLADGDKEMIVQVFRRNSDNVISFVDQYLEGGLKLIETSQDTEGALKSFRTGIAFAKLADEAFPGKTYAEYAASFASWSPTEQKQFREGQAAYKAGRMAADPTEALQNYRRALRLAKGLNDLWGVAMSQAAIVHAELKLSNIDKADEIARQAVQSCAQLGLRLDNIRVYIAWGDATAASNSRGHGANHYHFAYQLLTDSDDPELRQKIVDRWVDSLKKAGQPDAAEQIRKQYGVEPESAETKPTEPQ